MNKILFLFVCLLVLSTKAIKKFQAKIQEKIELKKGNIGRGGFYLRAELDSG